MFRRYLISFLLSFIITAQYLNAANVGLLVMATGKYISFVPPLVRSANRFFCTDHKVTYFIFADQPMEQIEPMDNIVIIYQKRLGWPFDTMMRYHTYYAHKDSFEGQDYLFACDADMLFVGEVGSEILGERVATIHPGFVGCRGTYETNPQSLAYISDREGEFYFAGGFYGGTKDEVMQIAKTNSENIDIDYSKELIAVWHDESHWNRYCIDHKPTVILTPSYCYPESLSLPYTKRLLALDKNHSEMRKE